MVVLYSTGCPKCKVLEKKLEKYGVEYTLVSNQDDIIKKGQECGFVTVPQIELDGELMDFVTANKWLGEHYGYKD